MNDDLSGRVIALSKSPTHTFKKISCQSIRLLEGLGVEGDAHAGKKVKHRSRVAANPNQPNLRQVHLIHQELHEELREQDFNVRPGEMGENITTSGIDLLGLPEGTILAIGESARIEITGLRNPCQQLEQIKKGLMQAVLGRDQEGKLIRKAGIMAIVLQSGLVHINDSIQIHFPAKPFIPLDRV